MGLRFPPPATRAAHTTPVATRAPSDMWTKAPGSSLSQRSAIAIGGVDRDRYQHVDDASELARHGRSGVGGAADFHGLGLARSLRRRRRRYQSATETDIWSTKAG
jgi:hypothetical protein